MYHFEALNVRMFNQPQRNRILLGAYRQGFAVVKGLRGYDFVRVHRFTLSVLLRYRKLRGALELYPCF